MEGHTPCRCFSSWCRQNSQASSRVPLAAWTDRLPHYPPAPNPPAATSRTGGQMLECGAATRGASWSDLSWWQCCGSGVGRHAREGALVERGKTRMHGSSGCREAGVGKHRGRVSTWKGSSGQGNPGGGGGLILEK